MKISGGNALFDWLEEIFPKTQTGYTGDYDRDDDVSGALHSLMMGVMTRSLKD
jgi:hypothetical protein